jgi:ribosomal protein L16/L10AE
MKAYHLRRTAANSRIDSLYIPEDKTLKSYFQPEYLIVDYSDEYYLNRVQAVVDGKKDELMGEMLNETEIDEKTALKIKRARDGINKYLDTAGNTENLIRIFTERAPKSLKELLRDLIS